jgi:translation initiation factor IF-1
MVELAGHADSAGREAFVAQVKRRAGRAEVAVLLADGSDATARLDVGELDWLDVRTGDIVFVRRSPCAALSA